MFVILGHQFQNQGLPHLMQFIYSFHIAADVYYFRYVKKEVAFSNFVKSRLKCLLISYVWAVFVMSVLEPVKKWRHGKNWLE